MAPAIVRAECRAAWNSTHAIEHRDVSATSRCVSISGAIAASATGISCARDLFRYYNDARRAHTVSMVIKRPRSSAFSPFVLFLFPFSLAI
mgnify:CR=1 FL=1